MESPKAVANFFIKRSLDTGIEVTPMKLLKLVYLAHGWHLGFGKGDLITEAVEAWQYGPVVKSVYHKYKDYGNEKISSLGSDVNVVTQGGIAFKNTIPMVDENNNTTINLLNLVWDSYKEYSGLDLSAITHQPDSPWDIVWNKQGGKERKSAIIGNDIIKKYYEQKVADLPDEIKI